MSISSTGSGILELLDRVEKFEKENAELRAKELKFVDKHYPETFTMHSNNYAEIQPPEGLNFLFATILNWGSATGGFSLVGGGNYFYISGDAETRVQGLIIRFWYREE